MKKVIFTLSSTCLMFLGQAQINTTIQTDRGVGKDANAVSSALSSSVDGGQLTGSNEYIIQQTTSGCDENTVNPSESKRLFEKIVFVEVSADEDSVLFKPLSNAWGFHWKFSSDLTFNGSALMNSDRYKSSFDGHTENLWTVLHPMIIDGTIHSYYPYDPLFYGLGTWDGYELKYPVVGEDEKGTFLTSESTRENMCFLLGSFDPQPDIPLSTLLGEDSVLVLADGSEVFVYSAPGFNWCSDKDIVKYKLRVRVLLNKNGKEKKRVITSIAPIVNQLSSTGEIDGEQEMLWLDFDELEPLLKKAYYFDEDWKSVSYLDFFKQKVKNTLVKAN